MMDSALDELTCQAGDEIKVGDSIAVKLVKVRGTCAYIGIQAPRDGLIVRPDAKSKLPKQSDDV